jgi:hypothetical protein
MVNLPAVHCMPEISKVSYLSHGSLIFLLADPPLRLLFQPWCVAQAGSRWPMSSYAGPPGAVDLDVQGLEAGAVALEVKKGGHPA